jgi:hypothetical protein
MNRFLLNAQTPKTKNETKNQQLLMISNTPKHLGRAQLSSSKMKPFKNFTSRNTTLDPLELKRIKKEKFNVPKNGKISLKNSFIFESRFLLRN